MLCDKPYPIGKGFLGLQIGYFAGYTFFFVLGIAARKNRWLQNLTWKKSLPWVLMSVIAWPFLHIGIKYASETLGPAAANFGGGPLWPAMLYAFWEPFVAWGVIAAMLLVSRQWLNRPSVLWEWLGRRAYAVYVIHPLVLVAVSLMLRGWTAPQLAKFGVVAPLACIACWLVADPLVRLPGLRRIL